MSSPDREDPNYPLVLPVVSPDYTDASNRTPAPPPVVIPAPVVGSDYVDAINRNVVQDLITPVDESDYVDAPYRAPAQYVPSPGEVQLPNGDWVTPAPVVASDYVDAINRNVASQVVTPVVGSDYVDAINRAPPPTPYAPGPGEVKLSNGDWVTPAPVFSPAPVVGSDYVDAINRPDPLGEVHNTITTNTPVIAVPNLDLYVDAPNRSQAPAFSDQVKVSIANVPILDRISPGYSGDPPANPNDYVDAINRKSPGEQLSNQNATWVQLLSPDAGTDRVESLRAGVGYVAPPPVIISPDNTRLGEVTHTEMTPVEKVMVDLKYYDIGFQEIAQSGRDLSKKGFAVTDQLKEEGSPLAFSTAIGATALRAGVGFFEGATFLIRPDMWFQTGRMVVGLGQDLGAYLGTGVQASGVSGQMREAIVADPLGFTAEFAGGIAGGYFAGKAVGSVLDKVTGGKAISERVTGLEVESTVRDNIKGAEFTATVERKTLPGKVGEIMRGESVPPEMDVSYRTLTGEIKYKPSAGGATEYTGVIGTTDDPLQTGAKITLGSGETQKLFTPDTSKLSLAGKIKNKLGYLDDSYESKPFFSQDATIETYRPPPDSPLDNLFVSKDTPSETFQYKPGYEITATDVDSTITSLERGKVGGFKDFKEVGPEGVWSGPGEKAPLGGEGGKWTPAEFEPKTAPNPGEGLVDSTRYKIISGITDDAGKLLDDLDINDMKIEPEPGPRTPWDTTNNPTLDTKYPGVKSQIKAVDTVKDYLKSGGSGGVSEGGSGVSGLSKLDLIEMGVESTKPVTNVVMASGSLGAVLPGVGVAGGVASGFKASMGSYGGSDSILKDSERSVGDAFRSSPSPSPSMDYKVVSQVGGGGGVSVPSVEDLVSRTSRGTGGVSRVDPLQDTFNRINVSQGGIGGVAPIEDLIVKPNPVQDVFTGPSQDTFTGPNQGGIINPSQDPFSIIKSKPDTIPHTVPIIEPVFKPIQDTVTIQGPIFKPIQGPIFKPIQGTGFKPIQGPIFKPIMDSTIIPIQGPIFTPIQREERITKQSTIITPITGQVLIPKTEHPIPPITTPKPFFPPLGGGGGKGKRKGLGLGGVEKRKYLIASPSQVLKGLNKRRSII